jgi:hypothetical protein
MISSLLISMVVALQGVPVAKPAPIAAVPAAEAGPAAEVPADLARLTGPDTVAVMFVESLRGADQSLERVRAALGDLGEDVPMQFELRRLLKDAVRTDLEIPLDQPVLWWIDQPAMEGDEPPMGLGAMVMRQVFRVPGSAAATEKHRAETAQVKDPKARTPAPVRARTRGSSVSVLPNDLVVVSSDMDPVVTPGVDAKPSALLQRLPRSVICGRIDLGRLLDEQGDQLRMVAGFAQMSMMPEPVGEDATPEERRLAETKSAMAQGTIDQLNHVLDALMQLRRASFAVTLEGDDLRVWADWSREAPFPAGIDAATVDRLAARTPRGMQAYWGMSRNALDTLFGERLTIDDAVMNLGASDEQRKAWADAVARIRALIAQIEGGLVGGVAILDADADPEDTVQVISTAVKDAPSVRAGLRELAPAVGRSGVASVRVSEEGDTVTVTAEPNVQRLMQAVEALTSGALEGEELEDLQEALLPWVASMRFQGNDVLVTQHSPDTPLDGVALGNEQATDIRGKLVTGSWGTLDWFVALDLRDLMALAASEVDAEDAAAILKELRGGQPLMFRASQGVQGSTARLTVQLNLSEMRDAMQVMEKISKQAAARAEADSGDADADDDEEKTEKGTDASKSVGAGDPSSTRPAKVP